MKTNHEIIKENLEMKEALKMLRDSGNFMSGDDCARVAKQALKDVDKE